MAEAGWDLDMQIEASYDNDSVAEMEAYEAMLADYNEPIPMEIEEAVASQKKSMESVKQPVPLAPEPPPMEETNPTTTTTTTTTSPTTATKSSSSKNSPTKQKRPTNINYVLRNPPLDTSFVAFTTTSGERMYLRCNKEKEDHGFSSSGSSTQHVVGNTAEDQRKIANTMAAMVEKIQKRKARREALEAASVVAAAEASSSSSSSSSSSFSSSSATAPAKARDLWVDKYAPRHFSDLLSPERTNRDVLRWIKSWDPAVFGTQAPPAKKITSKYGNNSWGKSTAPLAPENKKDPNDRSPPEHKAILICGPPGLGKTTLAHIVAKHAGYTPFEINASDDRSGSKLTQKIKDAMEMQAMFGENKPNCIILDEIDGAQNGGESRSAIAAIVRMIKNTTATGGSQKGSKQSVGHVTRPIICICNNLYAPALRPLRAVAKIFVMNATKSKRLGSRIKTICRQEKVVLRPDALQILCSRTDNDIRSCLNTLQFLSTRCSLVSRDQIMNTCVGHKDRKVALFDAWKSIFHAKAAGARRATQVHTATTNHHRSRSNKRTNSKTAPVTSAISVMSMASQLGRDMDRVLDGVHENFLAQHYNDPMFLKSTQALDWMCFGDLCSHLVMAKQQWKLMKYVSSTCAGVHYLCRSTIQPTIAYPRQAYASRTGQTTNMGMLDTFAAGLFKQSGGCTTKTIVRDVLSPWLDIVSPRVRPISKSLMSSWEQRQVDHLVVLLSGQSITFTPEIPTFGASNNNHWGASSNRATQLVMDPPMHTLVDFTDQSYAASHHVLSADVIRTVAREIDLASMRKNDAPSSSSSSSSSTSSTSSSSSSANKKTPGGTKRARSENETPATGSVFEDDGVTPKTHGKVKDNSHLIEKAKEKKAKYVPRDFFGRKINENDMKGKKRVRALAPNTEEKKRKGETKTVGNKHVREEEDEEDVTLSLTIYKFIPGFTNAVKRRVNMSDFL